MSIREKIEKTTEQRTLYKMRKIIIKEFRKDYYDNVTNVLKVINLYDEIRTDSEGLDYFYQENMILWQNGMVSFSNIGNQTPAQRFKTKKRNKLNAFLMDIGHINSQ